MKSLWLRLKENKLWLWSAAAGGMIFFLAFYLGQVRYGYWSNSVMVLLGMLVGAAFGVLKIISNVDNGGIEKIKQDKEELLLKLIEVLATAIEERDPYTYGHSRRVAMLALALGIKLGLDDEPMQQLKLAALLHDIGKIGIPDTILNKTDKLTPDEYDIIKSHPVKGGRILRQLRNPQLESVVIAVEGHHELYDGTGYPDGLKGQEISLLARILAIADSFDAMTSDRPYRHGMGTETALTEIKRCAGTQFDPDLAKLFISIYSQGGSNSVCSLIDVCPIFKALGEPDIGKAYELLYCKGDFKNCARRQMRMRGITVPIALMPDGRMNERLERQQEKVGTK